MQGRATGLRLSFSSQRALYGKNMTHSLMTHRSSAHRFSARRRFSRALLVTFCSFPLLLTGCAAEDGGADHTPADVSPEAEETTDASGSTDSAASGTGTGTATAKIDGTDYTFDLAFCAIGDEDTLAHGPGTSSTGEDAYLDIDFVHLDDSWQGEVRIDLGVNTQFSSSDDFYLFTTYRDDGDMIIANIAVMSMFSATGTYWVDGEQTGVDGNLEVNCS